jgi:hypothetical protein
MDKIFTSAYSAKNDIRDFSSYAEMNEPASALSNAIITVTLESVDAQSCCDPHDRRELPCNAT